MKLHRVMIANVLLCIALTLLSVTVHAADFGAEMVDISGKVYVIQKATGKKIPAKLGMKIGPGDVIETDAEAEAEILFDDGNVTRIDENTRLEITKLSMEPDSTRESTLNLAFGRIKNSVSKLATTKSKFEVNSKTVTAGVTGTPPWVVNVIGGKNPAEAPKTEIDLLKGEKGGVFVRGTDPKASMIVLTPGTRTVAQMGAPPMNPFPISAARMSELQTRMPITTPPAVRQEKRQQLDTKPVEASKDKKDEKKKEEAKEEAKKESKKEDVNKSDKADESAKSGAKGDEPVVGGAATVVDPTGKGAADTANTGSGGTGPATDVPVTGKSSGSGLVMDYMTHIVSVAPVAAPSTASPPQDPTGIATQSQVTQGTNALAGSTTTVAPTTTRVRVQVGVVYK